ERAEIELGSKDYVLLRERDLHAVAAERGPDAGTGPYLCDTGRGTTTATDDTATTTSGIAYRAQGAAAGIPVAALPGPPGPRVSPAPARDALRALGLRVLTYDRPGYGDTPGGEARPVRELALDVLDVLDHAGVVGPVGLFAGSGGTAA